MNMEKSEGQAVEPSRGQSERPGQSRLGLTQARHWRKAAGRIVPLGAYSAAILYFGTSPAPSFPGDSILSQDKLLHALAFGGLAVLFYRCSGYFWPTMRNRLAILGSVGFATIFGAALELIQSTLPYRSMELGDLAADFVGAVLCVGVARRLHLERPLFAWEG
jgi:VanZ family protein